MKKTSLVLMILVVASKLLGFLREMVLSAIYGTSVVADAFVYSFSQPMTIFSIVIAAFATGFIPMYTRIKTNESAKQANLFMNNILNIVLLIATFLSLFIFIFADDILKILLSNVAIEHLPIYVGFLRITIFTMLSIGVVQLMTGFLQQQGSFFLVTMLSLPMNFILIAAIFISGKTTPWLLPWGTFFAYLSQALLIVGYARIKGFTFKPIIDLSDPYVKKMIVLALPMILGAIAASVTNIYQNSIVSEYSGGLAQLNYAVKLGGFVDTVFGYAMITIMYPELSRAISLKHDDQVKKSFSDSLLSLAVFVLPAVVGLILFAEPIIEFVYLRGEMTDVRELTDIFIYYCYGLSFLSLNNLLFKVFYAFQNNWIPNIVTIITSVLQMILSSILFDKMGMVGIALAISLVTVLASILLIGFLRPFLKQFDLKHFMRQLAKIILAVVVMSVAALAAYRHLITILSARAALLVTIGIAAFVYLIVILFLKVDTIQQLIYSIRNKEGY